MNIRRRAAAWSALALLAFLVAGCAGRWIGDGFPRPGEETIDAPGLSQPVRIDYDEYYVPHIRALSENDAIFGLGYAMASARQLQLDMMRRTARGDLSGLTGPTAHVRHGNRNVAVDMVEVDAFLRLMDFVDTGRRYLAQATPETRRSLDAFAAGINAFAVTRAGDASAPYSIPGWMGGKGFAPWSAEDTASLAALMSFAMASNLSQESFAVTALRDGLPLRTLLDWVSPEISQPVEPYAYLERRRSNLSGLRFSKGYHDFGTLLTGSFHNLAPSGGSNAWVVGPSKSKSGKPIVANDPHLGATLPPPWIVAHVQCPDFNVAGAFMPGLPAPISGHNDKLAWGVTVTYADTLDLAIEDIDGAEKTFTVGDETFAMARRTVRVGHDKTARDVTLYATSFGPIISEIDAESKQAVTMRWTGWDGSPILDAAAGLFRARTAADLAKLSRDFGGLSLNLLYGDAGGHIGWSITGDLPRRDGYTGLLPKDGADPNQNWVGLVDPDERPSAFDPKEGFIAKANDRPTGAHAAAVGTSFAAPYRGRRIAARLAQQAKWDAAETAALQFDVRTERAEAVLPVVLAVAARDEDAKAVQAQLEKWNRELRADSRGALYFEVFVDTLTARLLRDLPEASREAFNDHDPFSCVPVDALPREESAWWGGEMARDVLIEEALAETMRRLKSTFGDNLATATWGDVHRLYLEHPLAEAMLIGKHYRLPPMPIGGDATTVAATPYLYTVTFDAKAYASLRMVTDLAEPSKARFSLPGGQSAIPTHPSYAHLLEGWYEGGNYPLFYDERDIADAPLPATVFLKPGSK